VNHRKQNQEHLDEDRGYLYHQQRSTQQADCGAQKQDGEMESHKSVCASAPIAATAAGIATLVISQRDGWNSEMVYLIGCQNGMQNIPERPRLDGIIDLHVFPMR
jgi:hypothetical protein